MSPRPDVSEERKSQILDAAMAVFARLGFHQARMDDIAEEAGMSKGALYLYYKSKDAIIAAILKFFFNQEMKRFRVLLESEPEKSIREQLLSLNQMFAMDMKWLAVLVPVMFEFYAVAARQKEVRLFLKDYFREYRTIITALIQRGIERGEFRQVDAETVAVALAALYEGLALLWIVDPQGVQWETTITDSIQLFFDGIQAQSTEPA